MANPEGWRLMTITLDQFTAFATFTFMFVSLIVRFVSMIAIAYALRTGREPDYRRAVLLAFMALVMASENMLTVLFKTTEIVR
jgi:hypothetical protein